MPPIVFKLRFTVKQRLLKLLRQCREAAGKIKILILISVSNGRTPQQAADTFRVHRTTVYRLLQRFQRTGEDALMDHRRSNGPRKLTDRFLDALHRAVRGRPPDFGWRRPTWTRELLVRTRSRETGIRIHAATMSRALPRIRARRGRPKPTVGCPWSKPAKTRRLHQIRRLVEQLPADEVAFYEDEVDIHLNPKIGWDWMVRGQQKPVVTPGVNEKWYWAGAMQIGTGEIVWVTGEHKDSWLFVRLLAKLYWKYPQAKKIHVILDNYGIHDSKLVAWALLQAQGRIVLHPLPPYCPDDNRIERVGEDLHANVTRNHSCASMTELRREVRRYLDRRNRRLRKRPQPVTFQ
jgi:transposase